jgi:lysophospholipase L1-like esterase
MLQRAALTVALFAGLVACRGGDRSEPQKGGGSQLHALQVVVLGSSTAAATGLTDPQTSWVNRYAAYLATEVPGSKVTNLAVGGYTTFHVLPTGTTNPQGRPEVDPAHNITAALALHPDAIIVNLPSNDAASGVPVEDSLANIRKVATLAAEAHAQLWVTTSQPRALPPDQIQLLVAFRDRIREDFAGHAIDFFTPLAAPDATPNAALNIGDGIHPNAEGHRLLFEQVKAAKLPAAIESLRQGRGRRCSPIGCRRPSRRRE